jgi:putative ABC transport system permease protein
MEIALPLTIALRALRVNKSRSFLTMLGIIIGIAAVIVMVAVGTGASRRIAEQIASMGSNLLIALPGSTTSGGIRGGFGSLPSLTYDDVAAIRSECPAVALAAPEQRGTAQAIAGNANWSTVVYGATNEMFSIREWTLAQGRFFSQNESDGLAKVCVLGQTVAKELFGDLDPVGSTLRLNSIPFTVVGLLAPKGRNAMGQDQDDVIFAPIRAAQTKLFGNPLPDKVGVILLQARSAAEMDAAQRQVEGLLDQRHRIGPAKERDYSLRNLTEIMSTAQESSRTMALLLGAVASVSLVVGGIGIMNIMLVSVTERTREIGIRISIGARQRDILLQFLAEAVLLTFAGGVLGIALGAAGAVTVNSLLGWHAVISPQAVVLAVAFSGAVGVFFGFYPARKAANLDPIDALRRE